MNRRQLKILERLITDSEFYTVDRLSKIFKKSKRTIYGDIQKITTFYQDYDMNIFSVDAKGVIEKKHSNLDKEILLEKIDFYSYELSLEERTNLIIYIFLFSNRPVTVNYISELLFCSRATVVKNMNDVKDFVAAHGSEIKVFQNKGYILTGNEVSLRELFLSILEKDPFLLKLYFQSSEMFIQSRCELETIRKVTISECLLENLLISENSQFLLENYLYFVRWRLDFGKQIINFSSTGGFRDLGERILKQLINTEVSTQQAEAYYLGNLLKQMKVISKSNQKHSLVAVHLLVRIFIEEISKKISMALSDDSELFTNLSNHMFDILEKRYQQQQESDELLIFIEKNQMLIDSIKENVYVFENYIHRPLTDVEVGYLALHLQASIEKENRKEIKLNVLLVCNSGVGTSQLLKTQLNNIYGFNFLPPVAASELQNFDYSMVDLVISTVDLKVEVPIPIAQINFNIAHTDLAKIDRLIEKIPERGSIKKKLLRTETEKILNYIYPSVIDHGNLFEELRIVVENYFLEESKRQEILFSDLLSEDTIILDADAKTGIEAIRTSTSLLEKKQFVNEMFSKAIIDSIENYGPYMLISDDVLFPHAGFDQGANITGFSFVRLKKPVSFRADKTDSVDLIFTLSASDNSLHVDALFSLLEFLNNSEFKDKLRKAKTPSEVLNIIRDLEKTRQ